ncbi:hypothetical protein PL71_08535 [Pseudoalteromonas distincta]|mgnify:CR=1 FL=1|jgi:hypothetical protein|uniref:Uncharacterized protein n=1 Tax=Pseudoalteromonas distincta TaxID=77608 RepID=A0ABT9GEE0_9GAMM|nr:MULTISPECIES: hypothetical protein [Pseudoalteromonas distincta group]KHM49504.1 hypothetical protein PL71_08535 [Pseudoalteromonas elyakovii]KID39548.1 hypothetical protein QT16_06485 [Pseudoalteromonas distincta]MDP4484251.1 hypothetical protein [Pseudoalteromonas elyakovii]
MLTKKTKYFEIKAFVDQNKKELIHSVKYKRKKIKSLTLNDALSKEYNERALLTSDLKRVLGWVDHLLKINLDASDNAVIVDSLFTSISITYYKCFAQTKNTIRKKVQLSKNDIEQSKYGKTDELLYDLRMKFVAHRGQTEFEYHKLIKVNAFGKFPSMVIPISAKAQKPDSDLVLNIKELVISLLLRVEDKNKLLLEKIESNNV